MALASVLDAELESRSKSLFGNRHMLRVAQEVASRVDPFTAKDIAEATGVPYSTTHRLIRQLEQVGLLESNSLEASGQHRWYGRASHKFWGAVEQLCGTDRE